MKSQSNLVNVTRQHDSQTLNGATTHSTSLNNVLDMFFLAGASRTMSEQDIIILWEKAKSEDLNMAVKCLFWARDCRGGAGEKRFFRVIISHLMKSDPELYGWITIFIPDFGSWKDIFLTENPTADNLDWISRALTERDDNLCAKWFPRRGKWFSAMYKHLNMTPKGFRKLLVGMTRVVETQMCAKKFDEIEFSKVPSKAFHIYKKSFAKQDPERFTKFVEAVNEGAEKVNSGQLFPYELYQSFMKGDAHDVIKAQWNNLPDYVGEGSFLPVCDVSGSMNGLPMEVSVSLGVYLSERNKSVFKDAFITFTGKPEMQYLQGDVIQRFSQLRRAHWEMNTNLQAVFRLILDKAVTNSLPQSDMPGTVIIISDMEFDEACPGLTNFELIQERYSQAGYTMPKLIFWNVNGRIGNVPVSADQSNVGLVSGASPAIVKSVLSGKDFTPVGVMKEVLNSERYKQVTSFIER